MAATAIDGMVAPAGDVHPVMKPNVSGHATASGESPPRHAW